MNLRTGCIKKTLKQYIREATRIDKCLIHPSQGAATHVWILRHGLPPKSKKQKRRLSVCHTCDNTQCIVDKHQFLGTQRTNVLDAVKKGRHSCFKLSVVKARDASVIAYWKDPVKKEAMRAIHRAKWKDSVFRRKQLKNKRRKSYRAALRAAWVLRRRSYENS